MAAERTSNKEDKTRSKGPDPTSMLDMMEKCCSGDGTFSDCSTMMKCMVEKMRRGSRCVPETKDAGPEEGKNERAER